MSTSFIALLVVFVVAAALRLSIVLSMFAAGIVYLWVSKQDIGLLVDQTLNTTLTLNVLLAVPLFILTANIMNASTISERLWTFANTIVGRLPGGHGHVTVVTNLIMSSMTGSAASDAAGAGMVAIRMMRKQGGYPGGLAVAVASAAALLGPLIPPSIPMVLYALISGASIGALFLAGIVPGLLMAVSISILILLIARRRKLPRGEPVPLRQWPTAFGQAFVPLTLPAVLLGGIWGGVFTPTEAAAVAALWAMIIGGLWYRSLSIKTLVEAFQESSRQSAIVMLLLISSFIVNFAITNEGIGDSLSRWIAGLNLSPLAFLLLVNVMFLVLGTVLDSAVMLLVFVPVLLPTVKALGIDLVHFGVVVIVNFMIAIISPPYGLILFIMSSLTKVPMREINREIWQFCVPLSIVLLILIAFPQITLFVPHMFGLK
ncbi:TRAP transporter large permease [Pseudorhodoplanes sinuspersici]|uniref:TRAP transporter large permease protein n=1 Tax=Pseudorhodoplanes sinuspersici TaxID=1235591 RepID=A0A1W6ZX48_9HYPH|nr:TRAP transporter large permease [Pseudorhodoplanes sinuspersici]ARQ01962.1 permease [Pseudorhodoplanes sinuspersici]RKE73737.1 tripartite ATP-independent transporter DctM subunit [Pseudorhodoplanes sinuspersici]